jgi:regulator of protease activity HflC (stomatin/prohibitin superfamily)
MDGMQTKWAGLKREIIIWEYERGLFYRDGKFEKVLGPGRYSFWRLEKVRVAVVSLRVMSEIIDGQSMLTADKVEVRVSLVAQYQVSDPARAINEVESYSDQLYQDLQLNLRDIVTGYEVDALLESRSEVGEALLNGVTAAAEAYGVTLKRVGIRDIVLPGTVKNVFLKEVEAERAGRAELVRARHEVAAARARANTARIMSDNPNVARMQEWDALVQVAGRHGSMVLLPNLADLLVPRAVQESDKENGSQ